MKKSMTTVIIFLTLFLPLGGFVVSVIAEEKFDFMTLFILLIAGFIVGVLLAFWLGPSVKKNGNLTNEMIKNTYLVFEDDCIRGVALQPVVVPNGQKPEINRHSIAGLVRVEEFNISYTQVVDFETFSIGDGDLSYGRCFAIHTARASYSFVAMKEQDIASVQSAIRNKVK